MDDTPQVIQQKAFDIATNIAIQASEHVLKYWCHPLNKKFDKDLINHLFEKEGVGNYATRADKESEELIITAIKNEPLFKDHTIVGEESDAILTDSDYKWFIDPIDGTISFKHGLPEFGVCIGLVYKNEPIVGVIARPALGQYMAAQKGKGAAVYNFSGEKLLALEMVQQKMPTTDKLLIGVEIGNSQRIEQVENLFSIINKVNYFTSYASASAGLYRLALRQLDGFISQKFYRWDIAGAICILEEMGGKVTSFDGSPIDWNSEVVSTLSSYSPEIHSHLLSLLSSRS